MPDQTESRALFDAHAHHYNEAIPSHVQKHYLQKRVRFIERLNPGPLILDAGCGTGKLLLELAGRGFQPVGMDDSLGMLKILKQAGFPCTQAGLTDLPYKDGSFDLVCNIAVLHHVGEPERIARAISEMVRVTRPGGKIVIWDHNPRNPYWKIFMKKLPWDNHVHRLIPLAEIVRGFKQCGILRVESHELGFVPDFAAASTLRFWQGLESWMERLFFTRWLCAHHVVVGYK